MTLIKKIMVNTGKGFLILLSFFIPITIGVLIFSTTTLDTLTHNMGHNFLGFGVLDLVLLAGMLCPYTTAWYFYGRPNGEKWSTFMD